MSAPPTAYEVGGALITGDSPDQVYAAASVQAACRRHLANEVGARRLVEIGGGYGGMTYWLSQLVAGIYTIIDLPVVNVLQGYFLAKALGPDRISLHGEPEGEIVVWPTHSLDAVPAFDVLINKDSMPEIPEAAVRVYLNWAKEKCTGIFYSCNQEGAAEFAGVPQVVVPELIASVGGFERLTRDLSWLRRGYVEEVYQLA